jgi:hypothetical protein
MTAEEWMDWLYAVAVAEKESKEDMAAWWFNLLFQWGEHRGEYFKLIHFS